MSHVFDVCLIFKKFTILIRPNKRSILKKNQEVFRDQNLLSINQLNAQIKLSEVCKSKNDANYPIKWDLKPNFGLDLQTRSSSGTYKLSRGEICVANLKASLRMVMVSLGS